MSDVTKIKVKGRGPKKSQVQLYGLHMSSCGYCKRKTDSSCSYGVVASDLSSEDYLRMMMIGWRRSGTYFYKPAMHVTCCPQYTIRLEASRFVINKSQRQVLRRVQRYLETGTVLANLEEQPQQQQHQPQRQAAAQQQQHQSDCNKNYSSSSSGQDHKKEKGKKGGAKAVNKPDSHPSSSSSAAAPAVHNMTIELAPAEYTDERYELYRKYQIGVHKDDPKENTPAGFKRFLVESPLFDPRSDSDRGGSSSSSLIYGTYHQLYRLDGRLVAVGVIDLVPDGLSSVYLFYDPDEHHLSLGKYTALKEIEFCREHGLKYYYMGYYIHSCPKMRYKGDVPLRDIREQQRTMMI